MQKFAHTQNEGSSHNNAHPVNIWNLLVMWSVANIHNFCFRNRWACSVCTEEIWRSLANGHNPGALGIQHNRLPLKMMSDGCWIGTQHLQMDIAWKWYAEHDPTSWATFNITSSWEQGVLGISVHNVLLWHTLYLPPWNLWQFWSKVFVFRSGQGAGH